VLAGRRRGQAKADSRQGRVDKYQFLEISSGKITVLYAKNKRAKAKLQAAELGCQSTKQA
jgi:hypothetical protein